MLIILILFVALVVNFFISTEVGKLAETRELGKEKGFWISFLLGPVLGLLFVLASRQLTNEQFLLEEQKNEDSNETKTEQENQLQFFLIVAGLFIAGLIWSFTN